MYLLWRKEERPFFPATYHKTLSSLNKLTLTYALTDNRSTTRVGPVLEVLTSSFTLQNPIAHTLTSFKSSHNMAFLSHSSRENSPFSSAPCCPLLIFHQILHKKDHLYSPKQKHYSIILAYQLRQIYFSTISSSKLQNI